MAFRKQVWTRWLYLLDEHNTVFALNRYAICNKCFPGPTRVFDANGVSIAATVFTSFSRWQTDWQTDRPRYSVGNNRRIARWRCQVLLLSTATTSIYWSSRLDRSDQLQQSAAIFSCKTRRVAVYVETHCNIPRSLEESVYHRRTRQVTQLFTYLLTRKLFSSCIRRYLVSRACDWVTPALSAVLLTFSFQFSLLFFHVGSQAAAAS